MWHGPVQAHNTLKIVWVFSVSVGMTVMTDDLVITAWFQRVPGVEITVNDGIIRYSRDEGPLQQFSSS